MKPNEFRAFFEEQHGRCFYCKKPMKIRGAMNERGPDANGFLTATHDHFVSRSRKGKSRYENAVLSCQACNERKGNKKPTSKQIQEYGILITRVAIRLYKESLTAQAECAAKKAEAEQRKEPPTE